MSQVSAGGIPTGDPFRQSEFLRMIAVHEYGRYADPVLLRWQTNAVRALIIIPATFEHDIRRGRRAAPTP